MVEMPQDYKSSTCFSIMRQSKEKTAGGIFHHLRGYLSTTSLQESFTEHDLRAKVSSDIDSDIDAQKLLQHANVATTRKHYRRKGSITVGAQGFSVIPTNK